MARTFLPPRTLLLMLPLLLAPALHSAAPAPWAGDPVLSLIAQRWLAENVVAGAAALAALDADVAAALALQQGPAWNRTFRDIDYSSDDAGFWQVSNHSVRVRLFATALASPGSAYYQQPAPRAAALAAFDWWLSRDPLSTSWWYMGVGMPGYNAASALLLWTDLESNQTAALFRQLARSSYAGMTGANLIWEASNVLFRGVLAGNRSEAEAAAAACHGEIALAPGADEGMKADGSFFQHGNQLYSGGYGQSFVYDVAALLALVEGTPLAFPAPLVDLFGTWLVSGALTMIFWAGPVPLWDLSVVGRDIVRPYGSALKFGFGQCGQEVDLNAKGLSGIGGAAEAVLGQYAAALNGSAPGVPAAALGHAHFYQADYSRANRANWSASVRMQSTRTLRSECVNDEGIQSLHLADGAAYLYLDDGDAYHDIPPAWDWERIPGTAVRAGAAPLTCADVQGSSTSVTTGGASDGDAGVALQRFVAPAKQNLTLDRLHGFFTRTLPVRLANISATSRTYATVDSRRMVGEVWAGGAGAPRLLAPGDYSFQAGDADAPAWLWHANVGYVIAPPAAFMYGNVTVPLFSLWFELASPRAALAQWVAVPAVSLADFETAMASAGGVAALGSSTGGADWSAAWGACGAGGAEACAAVGLFAAGAAAAVPAWAAGGAPAFSASCAGGGAGAAPLVRFGGASGLSVAVASPAQQTVTARVDTPLALKPASGEGWACEAGGSVVFTAPPSNGSSLVVACAPA
jgi:chondroitin AC lyase